MNSSLALLRLPLHTQLTAMPLPTLRQDKPASLAAVDGVAVLALAWDRAYISPGLPPILHLCSPTHTVTMPLVCHSYVMTLLRACVTPSLLSDSYYSVHKAQFDICPPRW